MTNNFIRPLLNYDNLESYVIRNEIYKSILNNSLAFKGEVLDAGCGSMPYKNIICANKNVTNYIGLDIVESLNYKNIKPDFLWDGIKMPFNDESFDVVIATEVLEHVPHPDIYLSEVKRVLRPGGCFYFTIPFLMSLHEVPHDYYRYTPYSLDLIFKRNGFIVKKISPLGGYNAALAQMIGLWVNMYLWGTKKKIMRIVSKPVIKFLYKNDIEPKSFLKSTMTVGFSGIILKPV